MTDGLIRRDEGHRLTEGKPSETPGENGHLQTKEELSPQNKINPANTLVLDFWLTEF